ncbi:hypothetical protein EIP86_011326 [Pleurotus ostreatoroseus]|nr:hypothetical protein EIP86_011326 [Pleurotus ostreatoroseus]
MFRSATTRIAHNSTVPGLARLGKDLKALQELINAEKLVMQTLQKLAQDVGKASEALKQWGNGEGDDLGDTLTGCYSVMLHFASALTRFSSHEASVRELMKAVRTREEHLDELKRRRKSLQSNADSADRKLSKMSSDNKNFQSQADALNKLRDEIRAMDTDIMNEEANLGDFKRSSAKSWMGTKFGALQECCEKGLIIGEMGKLIIAEIPLTPTQPGLPRPYYTGHARTDFLVSETQRGINEVMFSQDPNPRATAIGIRALPGSELPPVQMSHTGSSQMSPSLMGMAPSSLGMVSTSTGSTPDPSIRGSKRFSTNVLSPASGFVGLPEVSENTMGGLDFSPPFVGSDQVPMQPRSPPPQTINGSVISLSQSNPFSTPAQQSIQLSNNDPNEFGAYPAPGGGYAPRTSSLRNLGDSQPASPTAGPRGSSRFATFPVKAMGPRAQPGSMSTPMSPTLDTRAPSLDIDSQDDSFSSSVAQALGKDWISKDKEQSSSTSPTNSKAAEAAKDHTSDWTSPPPQYSLTPDPPSSTYGEYAGTRTSTTPTVQEEEEEGGLAYMSGEHDEERASVSSGGHQDGGRRVKFDSTPDVIETMQQEETAQPSEHGTSTHPENHLQDGRDAPPVQTSGTYICPVNLRWSHDGFVYQGETDIEGQSKPSTLVTENDAAPLQPSATTVQIPPAPSAVSPLPDAPSAEAAAPQDEKALNAAAAREVSRELDALMFSPPGTYPGSAPPAPSAPPAALQPRVSSYSLPRVPAPRAESIRDNTTSPPLSPPTSPHIESSYVRERDRSPSIPPASPVSDVHRSPVLQHSPPKLDTPTSSLDGRTGAPSSISLPPIRSMSPTYSSISGSTPYRTPAEFPATPPVGPGSFYNLPSLSGSGTLPSSGKTVSAALFRQKMRAATNPPAAPDLDNSSMRSPPAEVSPLNVKKRALPSSPRPQDASDASTAYEPPSTLRPSDGAPRPDSMARSSMHSERGAYDDTYDYISSYVDDPASGDERRVSTAGYGQGQFATNLDH